jgi:hypothetical protein
MPEILWLNCKEVASETTHWNFIDMGTTYINKWTLKWHEDSPVYDAHETSYSENH